MSDVPRHSGTAPAQSGNAGPVPAPTYVRQHELAVRYPVLSDAKWRRLVGSGELPSTRIGSTVIVATAAVEALLNGRSAE